MHGTHKNWSEAVAELDARGEAFVMVTLLGVRGSAPRHSGTKMVVTAERIYASIGGGHLEYKVIETARGLLASAGSAPLIEDYPLGPALGQCCGGSVSVLFEPFAATGVDIMLFGAGHVGRELVAILGALPCRVRWVDSRETQFPATVPANTRPLFSDTPAAEVNAMPAGAYYIVMTHNHQLDFDICGAILTRSDFRYLGLIGSKTKWRRFERRFAFKNYAPEQVRRIRCPVGLSDVPGKRPMEVAVSIAGEVIQVYHRDSVVVAPKPTPAEPRIAEPPIPAQSIAEQAIPKPREKRQTLANDP